MSSTTNSYRCSFTRIQQYLRKNGVFSSVNRPIEGQVQRNVEEAGNIIDLIDMVQRSPRSVTRRISARLSIPSIWVWKTLHTEVLYLTISR
jgi:hypothetical protein